MKFYLVPRPEPLIRSKRFEMVASNAAGRCAARRSGQRPGQRSGAGRLSQPLAQRENPRHYRGSPMELAGLEPATSWVRSRRPPALSLACLRGFRGGRGPVRGLHFSASFGPFALGSGQRTVSLARSRYGRRSLTRTLLAVPGGPRPLRSRTRAGRVHTPGRSRSTCCCSRHRASNQRSRVPPPPSRPPRRRWLLRSPCWDRTAAERLPVGRSKDRPVARLANVSRRGRLTPS
jgi:hypothetical protein